MENSNLKYQVKYCRVNMEDTCKLTEKTSGTSMVVSGLLRADIIQWEVMVFADNGLAGKSIKDTYKTKQRNVCTSDEFRCTDSPQCVPKRNTCNGVVDCQDKSDEKSAASCSIPKNLPTKIESKQMEDGSFEFKFTKLANSDRIDGYKIQVRDIINDEVVYSTFKSHTYASPPLVTFTVEGLTQGRKYEVRFQAVNPTGDGPWSVPVSFSTLKKDDKTGGNDKNSGDSDSSSSGMSGAQKAGIAIGIILALIVIVLIVVVVLKQRSKKKGASTPNKYANGKSNGGYEMERKP